MINNNLFFLNLTIRVAEIIIEAMMLNVPILSNNSPKANNSDIPNNQKKEIIFLLELE